MKTVIIACAAAAALLVAGCGSSGTGSASRTLTPMTTTTSAASSTETFPTEAEATTPEQPEPDVLSPGTFLDVDGDTVTGTGSGTLSLTVGAPVAVAAVTDSRFVGVPVTISDVTGTPTFVIADLGMAPVRDPDFGNIAMGSDPGEQAADRTACGRLPALGSALGDAGASISIGSLSGYDLDPKLRKVTGCVEFVYSAGDHPNRISYFSTGLPQPGETTVADASWSVRLPGRAATPPSGIVYRVDSNGGIDSVTYATANFGQAQDTSVAGSSWSKKIPTDGVDVATVVAQAGGGASSISCSITVDGQQVAKQTSHGPYTVVTCSATP